MNKKIRLLKITRRKLDVVKSNIKIFNSLNFELFLRVLSNLSSLLHQTNCQLKIWY